MLTTILLCWFILIAANADRTMVELLNENKITVAVLSIATPYVGYIVIPDIIKVWCYELGSCKQPNFMPSLEPLLLADWFCISFLIIIIAIISVFAILSRLNKLLKF